MNNIPPHAPDIEKSVLGAIMIDRQSAVEAFEHLQDDYFYKPLHLHIWQAMKDLFFEDEPIDLLTVDNKMKKRYTDSKISGGYLSDLASFSASIGNIDYHIQILKEQSIKRNLITSCRTIVERAHKDGVDTYDILDEAVGCIMKLSADTTGSSHTKTLQDALMQATDTISELQEQGRPSGMQTGYKLDSFLRLQKKKMICIAARPSMGKTAFLLNTAKKIASKGYKPAVISIETDNESLAMRMITAESRVSYGRITSGNMNEEEQAKVDKAISNLYDLGIIFDDQPGISEQQLRAKCKMMKQRHDIDVIFIDYMQLASADGQTREQQVANISKTIKAIGKEIDICMIPIAQLSRASEQRSNKRPQLSDLRYSGQIEQDADAIIFIHRPEEYGIHIDEDNNSTKNITFSYFG